MSLPAAFFFGFEKCQSENFYLLCRRRDAFLFIWVKEPLKNLKVSSKTTVSVAK